jgi:endonuclease/exonuclease/phosphatase family metal-dependent hydrolase
MPVLSLLTWNLQGASTDKESILPSVFNSDALNYNIMCLQEVGPRPPKFEPAEQMSDRGDLTLWYRKYDATHGGWAVAHLAFGQAEGGSRCSTAIAVRVGKDDVYKALPYVVIDPRADAQFEARRRILCVQLSLPTKPWICCVHAPASAGAQDYLNYMYTKINTALACWVAAGDHNVEPHNAPTGNKWGPVDPGAATFNCRQHPDKKYDYVTTKTDLKCEAVKVITGISAQSDHCPVLFSVVFPDR